MIDARVEYDYVVASADEWLADISEPNESATASLHKWLADNGAEYADTESIVRWAKATYGETTGLYGDGTHADVAMCNQDTLLDNDISFVFVNTPDESFLIVNGSGYWLHRPESAEVHTLSIMDDAEAFGYSSGYAGHTGTDCGAEWIVDNPVTLWLNGGGESHRIADTIRDGSLRCPHCDGELYVMVG